MHAVARQAAYIAPRAFCGLHEVDGQRQYDHVCETGRTMRAVLVPIGREGHDHVVVVQLLATRAVSAVRVVERS